MEKRKQARWEATGMLASVRKEGVSFLRENFGEVILVISGRAAGCTKALSQSSEGAIFSKRSSLRGQTALLTTLPPLLQVA